MSDIKILKEMIKQNLIVELQEKKNEDKISYLVNLEEPEDNYSITINGMPDHDNVIIIRPDAFKPSKIFNSLKNECKLADFVIIANTVKKKIGSSGFKGIRKANEKDRLII